MIYKAFNYRIYPNKEQQILLAKHFGCSRYIYNWALDIKTKTYQTDKKNLSAFDLMKKLPELKDELIWLKEVNSQCLQESILHLNDAYQRFFKHQNKFPKFKSKSNKQSYSFSQLWYNTKSGLKPSAFYIKNNKLHLMKFKSLIPIRVDRQLEGKMKSITVKKQSSGKYFVSILCELEQESKDKYQINESTAIGIDLGIKHFATLSNGEKIENPKFLKSLTSKLKHLQRQYSKKKRGSKNQQKARIKVARCYEQITNQRTNFLHQLSTKVIRENQTICLETLSVKNMVKNHNLASSISDASWSSFVSMLEYKANWYGNNIIRIGQFEPSSKMCYCGVKNNLLTLADREWTCTSCGIVHDRDILAANNIKSFALQRQG
jgi:putative transposase